MKTAAVAAAAALAVAAPLVGQAQAAPPTPAAPPDASYFAEAQTGGYVERYDDLGSEVTVIDNRWLVLDTYGSTPDGDDTVLSLWFNTRKGSRFYLMTCDDTNNATERVQVSRKAFFDRVATTHEREIEFSYDAERDRGTFTVTTGYFIDGEGLYQCPDLPPQD